MSLTGRHSARRRRGFGAVVALVLTVATPMVWVGEAAAATGPQTFLVVYKGDPREGAVSRVAAHGLINGVGTGHSLGVEFTPDGQSAGLTLITMPEGSVTARALNIVVPFEINPRSCVGTFTASGPVTFVEGTGAYAGASGGGTYTARGWAVLGRTGSGCGSAPLSFNAIIKVTGTLSFPGP